MIVGAWVCLLSPLAGALAITLAGGRISRRTAGDSGQRQTDSTGMKGSSAAARTSVGRSIAASQGPALARS